MACCDEGRWTRDDVAARFRVSLGMVKKLLAQRKKRGDISPLHHCAGRKALITPGHRQRLRSLIDQQPDLTLEELRKELDMKCSLVAIHNALDKMNLTLKKTLSASEQERSDVKAARDAWRQTQGQLESSRLIFIDESAAKTNLTRLWGRSPRGERVRDTTPHGHWCTTTMISSIRSDGLTACMTIEGSTTAEVFRAYVEHVLLPTLRPGDLVIADNLASHKNTQTRALIEKAGAQLCFLPAYSPDFNPIEKMWSKVKAILRSVKARTRETLLKAIAYALSCISAQDAQGYFASCGYTIN